MKNKQKQTHRYREQINGCKRQGLRGVRRVDEISEGDQKVQTLSYKINKSWGCNI